MSRQSSQATVTVQQVSGSIGGNLNLWIGLTFFALLELVELAYLSIASVLRNKKHKLHAASHRKC